MGRPPIGKVAMSATERWRRYRDRHRDATQTKPQTKSSTVDIEALQAEIGKLKAALAARDCVAPATPKPKGKDEPLTDAARSELLKAKSENDRLREQEAKLQARIRELEQAKRASGPRAVAKSDAKGDTLACKCIRKLGDENDYQALEAVRSLQNELKRIGADFQDLSDAWKPVEQKLTTPRARPIDFAKIEEVVKRYAQGKTGVGFGPIIDRVEAAVPETDWRAQNDREILHRVHNAVYGYLYQLGFRPTSASKNRWTKQ